jgi:hypothetical protein
MALSYRPWLEAGRVLRGFSDGLMTVRHCDRIFEATGPDYFSHERSSERCQISISLGVSDA